jgi:hypothetical protein
LVGKQQVVATSERKTGDPGRFVTSVVVGVCAASTVSETPDHLAKRAKHRKARFDVIRRKSEHPQKDSTRRIEAESVRFTKAH